MIFRSTSPSIESSSPSTSDRWRELLEDVKSVAIPSLPLAQQTRIVVEVERRLSVVEELEAVVTTNLQRATRLRQAVLQKAFTSELG
jgi:type I restriction enzyme S subunit